MVECFGSCKLILQPDLQKLSSTALVPVDRPAQIDAD